MCKELEPGPGGMPREALLEDGQHRLAPRRGGATKQALITRRWGGGKGASTWLAFDLE